MKKICLFLLSFLIIPLFVSADSTNFEPLYEMDTEIKDNYIYLMLSYDGDMVETINETISFKTKDIELTGVDGINGYEITKKEINENGKYTSYDISISSGESISSKEYAIIEFKVDKTKNADIFFYNIDGVNFNSKFRNKGSVLSLRKDNDLMIYTKKEINSNTKIQYMLIDNMYIFIILGIVLLIIVLIFINIPSKKNVKKPDVLNNEDDIDTSFYNKDI